MILTSKNNPLIKETALLKEKKKRKELQLFLVEGWKMTAECKKSNLQIEKVFVAESYRERVDFDEACIVRVSDDVFKYIADEKTPQGILCRVRIPNLALQKPTGKCLLLDGIADPGNLGAILRTANAAGFEEVYLTDDCTDAYAPKCVRASMSGVFFTKLYVGKREEILSVFDGFPIFVADMDGANVFSFVPPDTFALVIGNEANGVSEEVKKVASSIIKIPMKATQESLNAAVSAGIMMYELNKREFIK